MTSDNRRSFLKKSIWGTLMTSAGFPFFKNYQDPGDSKYNILSWETVRDQFPLSEDRVYFNTAGLGASPYSVIKQYQEWILNLEVEGETGRSLLKGCRKAAAEFFNCEPDEICFTRNTTEGINIISNGLPLKKEDEVILSTHEHVGGAAPWMHLAKLKGIQLKLIDLDYSGDRNLEIIEKAIGPKTKAICFSHVTCSNGMVLPVREIVKLCRSKGIYSCVDGAQSAGMIKVDLKDLNPDFYSTSGHKWMYGPKGTGLLYINKNIIEELIPTYSGAYMTEKYDLFKLEYSFRKVAEREEYGTRNIPQIMALKEAIEFQSKLGIDNIEKHGKRLCSLLLNKLENIDSIEILSPKLDRFRSAILSFRSTKIHYQELQKQLQNEFPFRVRGIYEGKLNAIRISCAVYNSEEEINQLSSAVKQIINRI